jgi:hypothetical protein
MILRAAPVGIPLYCFKQAKLRVSVGYFRALFTPRDSPENRRLPRSVWADENIEAVGKRDLPSAVYSPGVVEAKINANNHPVYILVYIESTNKPLYDGSSQ